jgi:hypothetical protein
MSSIQIHQNQKRIQRIIDDYKAKKIGTLNLITNYELYMSFVWETYILVDQNHEFILVPIDELDKFIREKY